MKRRLLFTNIDVFAITRELDKILSNSTIANIYEVEDLLIFKINSKEGRKNLIIKSDSRINLTNYDYPIPRYPSQYIMSLRKFLKNRKILSISQHNFDRIVIFELYNPETEPWRFVIELFNKGNFLFIDDKNLLKIAKKYRKFKDRDVLAGKEFSFPQSRGIDFLRINKEEFEEIIKISDNEIVRILARNINIAGLYSEEICYRAKIDKFLIGKDLTEEDIDKLFKSLKALRNQLLFGKINGHIVKDNNGTELAVLPFELKMFNSYSIRFFDSYNDAVDEFYSKIDSELIILPNDQKINQQMAAQEKILKNQMEYLEELKIKKVKYYEHGDFIYANFSSFEKLLGVILDAKDKKYGWKDIDLKLKEAKKNDLDGTKFFEKIIAASKELVVNINGERVNFDLRKSLGENANKIYARGKKAEKKIKGTIPAIKKTEQKIKKLKLEKESIDVAINYLIKRPKKKWYEKFRWFKSSDGFLVIGGRDASSNEIVFKKYLEENDLVFHTSIPGSPLTIVKNPEKKEIPKSTIDEAATFVASYSRAWKENWGVVDVFFVSPAQISKSPPSGEFLPKGSFMISGKKNIIKNARTELALGLELLEMENNREDGTKILYPKLIYGPKTAVVKQVSEMIIIAPLKTGLTKGKIAKKIKNYYINNSEKDLKKWINLLSLDDINLCLPTGNSEITS